MAYPELLLVVVLKALVEVAALSLMAQGVLRILTGGHHRQNFAYRLFQVIASPVVSLARWASPRFIAPQYHGLIAFLLLFWVWIALVYAKAYVCHAQSLACLQA
jgi:hypothetical protein